MQLSILQTLPTVLKKPRDIFNNTNANARPGQRHTRQCLSTAMQGILEGSNIMHTCICLTMLSAVYIGHVHLSCICIINLYYYYYFVLHVVPAKPCHCIMWTLDSVSWASV